MPYNETIANSVREQLVHLSGVEEKEMMGGVAFLHQEKMCVGVIKDDLLCQIDPDLYADVLDKKWLPAHGSYWVADERVGSC